MVPIPHSNLILLIIDALCPVPDLYYRMSIIPIEQYYGNASSLACHRAARRLNRRRPTSCINQHANVSVHMYFIMICSLTFGNHDSYFFNFRKPSSNNAEEAIY